MQTEYPHHTPGQHTQQQHSPAIPSQSPVIANDRSSIMLGGPYVFWMAFLLANAVQAGYPGSLNPGFFNCVVWLGVITAFGGLVAACSSGAEKRWKGIHDRRQMIASAGSLAAVPLASPQRFPDVEALPVPFSITLRPNWWFVPIIPCLLASGCFLVDVLIHVAIYLLLGRGLSASVQEGVGVSWGMLLLAVIPLTRLLLPQYIDVTSEGLRVQNGAFDWLSKNWQAKKRVMRWDEARLFAIRDGKPGGSFIRYELSSPTTVVTFGRSVRKPWFAAYHPAQPFGEYNAQMDALLALISARTGLLLYDVR